MTSYPSTSERLAPSGHPYQATSSRLAGAMPGVVSFLAPAVTAVVVAASARPDDPDAVGGLGLITVIPAPILVAAAGLSASFAAVLLAQTRAPSRLRTAGLVAHVAALLVVLHGLPALLEAEPRFATAWLHAGFVDALRQYGHPLSGVDARFSWPGFFAAVAAFLDSAGLASALPLLRFAPLVANLAYLLPLVLIGRALVPSIAGRWVVVWLFLLGNWVGQDYFSPQAVGYFLFLAMLAVLLTVLPGTLQVSPGSLLRLPARVSRSRWVSRIRGAFLPVPTGTTAPVAALGALMAVLVAFSALCMAHQLTPVVLTVDVAALVLVRRLGSRLLPVAMAAVLLGWISYGAADFWTGHLSSLLGSGSVSATIGANVAGRVQGSGAHLVVVAVRLALSLAVWALAAVGGWRVLHRGDRLPGAAVALALAPFPILGVQAYGGEAQLRLYLFTLPFMLCLVARLFVPAGVLTGRSALALAAVAVLATPTFYVARFGNEQFEQVRPGEVQAVAEIYRVAPRGAALVALTPNLPWRYQHFADYDYRPTTPDEFALGSVGSVTALMPSNPHGSYLVITRGQTVYASTSYGLPKDYGRRIEELIDSSGRFRLIYKNSDAALYQLLPGVQQ